MSFRGQITNPVSHTFRTGLLLWGILCCACDSALQADEPLGVRAAPGFEVTQFAGDDLAHDIYSMTIDSLGRVVVSGPGYVKILIDADRDGVAESAQTFVDGPDAGAQGMFFFGRDLLCAGDAGLIRYRDRDGNDQADGPPDVFLNIKATGEHDLHALRKGPDGWWYVIAGNGAGVTEQFAALPTSPVKQPHGGAILRLKPDLSAGEVFAHGFRNSYDFDFTAAGDVVACESDGERELSLPWYLPCRMFHVLPGSHLGWITNDWKRPDTFFDMPPVIASLGRGSPTGTACYQHRAFPEKYRDAIFLADWTFGRVWALPLTPAGGSWRSQPLEVLTAIGQNGFAPTDLEIGPGGELYVCMGGRGTRGAVYCIRPAGLSKLPAPWPASEKIPASPAEKLELCLSAPQPLSSWSRRTWEPLAKELTAEPFIKAAMDAQRDPRQRVRAIEILTEKFQGVDQDLAMHLAKDGHPLLRARAAWSIGRTQARVPPRRALEPYLMDVDPHVVRAATEALLGADPGAVAELTQPLGKVLANPDRSVRQTGMRILAGVDPATFQQLAEVGYSHGWRAAIPVAAAFASRQGDYAPYSIDIALRILRSKRDAGLKLEAVRVLQLGLGDMTPPAGKLPAVFDGYAPQHNLARHEQELDQLRIALAEVYPVGQADVDRELERTIALVAAPNPRLLDKILAPINAQSDPVDDIHRLVVAARMPTQPGAPQLQIIADALIHLESKIKARHLRQDSHWEDRIEELYAALVSRDPRLPVAILEHPDLGLPGHVKLLPGIPPERFDEAVTKFAQRVQRDPDYVWNADVVFLLGQSNNPAEKNLIRAKFADFALRGPVIGSLAGEPQAQDRPLFVEALSSGSVEVMQQCIEALQLLPPSDLAADNVTLARALRRLGDRGEERVARDQLIELLRRNLRQTDGYVMGLDGDPQLAAIDTWTAVVQQRFPEEFARQAGEDAGDVSQWKQRLAGVNWSAGQIDKGEKLFASRGCVQCHGVTRTLGPDLAGVAGRFSRDDLFTAIVFPSRDVSPRYQAMQIVTVDGQIRTGLIAYESVDGLVLRDANNHTYRIESDQIELRQPLRQSLMPTGLVKGLTDGDLADLYAYLRSLGLTTTAAQESLSR